MPNESWLSQSHVAELASHSNAWPFQEARALLEKRLKGQVPEKGYVLFETGYGPSGLPHIGTFGEVVRTTMVRNALAVIAPQIPSKLFAFSDDMDGLRKVPDNVPNKDMLAGHLNKPLTSVPDPFGTHESFAHHNNARLRDFLDSFGFDYEFKSATECYKSGEFDAVLMKVLANYQAIMDIVLPTLGSERRATYSPFLPVCPRTNEVLQVPMVDMDVEAGTIVYEDPATRKKVETPVTGGHCKLQWKADWGMRWTGLEVDYEMSGKDLIESVKLSSRICRALGGTPPVNLTYELFLDDNGEKISKSRGNGISVEEWLKYAPQESLSLFMYQKPKTAKRLFFDVIPKNVDEYLTFSSKFEGMEDKDKLNNPAFHIHNGHPPEGDAPVGFAMLLNLVSVAHTDDPAAIWHYITRYAPDATPENAPMLDKLVTYAIAYYEDFVKPGKTYRKATEGEVAAMTQLKGLLEGAEETDASALQNLVYEVGKTNEETFPKLKDWFQALYQVLLGQDQGPRFGSFIALYGVDETIALLDKAIAGEELA